MLPPLHGRLCFYRHDAGYPSENMQRFVMSQKTTLRIEFFSAIALTFLFGAWTLQTFLQWSKGDLTIVLVLITVFSAAAVGYDVYKTWQRISSDNSKATVPPDNITPIGRSQRPF